MDIVIIETQITRWLEAADTIGYGQQPIPTELDSHIMDFVAYWKSASSSDRLKVSSIITEEHSKTLLAFSERSASLAIRRSDVSFIVCGLIALGIDGWRYDRRENILILPLHHDACYRLHAVPENVFREAGEHMLPEIGAELQLFLRRKPEDKAIESMGYEVSSDSDGFRYRRTW